MRFLRVLLLAMLVAPSASSAAPPAGDKRVVAWAAEAPLKGATVKVRQGTLATSRIAGGRVLKPTAKAFTFLGAHMASAGTTAEDRPYLSPDNITPHDSFPPVTVAFRTSAKAVDFALRGDLTQFRVAADGRFTKAAKLPGGTQGFLVQVRFKTAKTRLVTLELGTPKPYFGGAVTSAPIKPAGLHGPRAIFVCDSWTQPAGADNLFTGYVSRTSRLLGWADAWPSGTGGTGFINERSGFVNLAARLQHDVIRWKPDIVIVACGLNDIKFDASRTGPAATAVLRRLRTALPNATIVVVGPWWASSEPNARATDDAIHQAATDVGVPFVDPIAENWITGDGGTQTPDGTGNADQFITESHPNQAGHDYLGKRLADALRLLFPAPR